MLVLRLGLAVLMLFAGTTKFVGTLPTGTLVVFTQAGMPENLAKPLVSIVGVLEILAGIALILGLLVRLAAIPVLAITLWVLAYTSVFKGILSSVFQRAGEPAALGGDLGVFFAVKDVAIVGAALFFLICGAGKLSVDHYIDARLQRGKGKEEVSEAGSRVSRGVMTHGRRGQAGFARTSEGNPSYPNAR